MNEHYRINRFGTRAAKMLIMAEKSNFYHFLSELQQMLIFYSCQLIFQALQATNGNVEAAIELLFNDME